MKAFRILPMLVFWLAFGCIPVTTLKISVLEPATIAVPVSVEELSVYADNNFTTMPQGRLDSLNNISFDPQFNYYTLTQEYQYGLADVASASPRFDRIAIANPEAGFRLRLHGTIDWPQVSALCQQDSTQAVFYLSEFHLLDTILVYSWFGQVCRATFVLNNHVGYKVLVPATQEIIGPYKVSEQLSWQTPDVDCAMFMEHLPRAKDMIGESCYFTGKKVGREIAPQWNDNVTRVMFAQGHKLIREGAQAATNGDWLLAADTWRRATSHKREKVSSKAAFNMALACEMEDKPDLAIQWINLADSLHASSYTRIYRSRLKTRVEDRIKLDRQMFGITQ